MAPGSTWLALDSGGGPIEEPQRLLPDWYDRQGETPHRRENTSWSARFRDVGLVESVGVLLINEAAPFVLTGCLQPPSLRILRSARKTEWHPHVYVSTAALVMTRTSATDYAGEKRERPCGDKGAC